MHYTPKFDILGIAPVTNFNLPQIKSPLKWLDKTIFIRRDIRKIFPWAKSLIIVGLGYNTNYQQELLYHPDYMSISKYAIIREYHKVIPKKLKNLLNQILIPAIEKAKGEDTNNPQHQLALPTDFTLQYKIHSDTFPVFEKGYAQLAVGGMTGYNNLWHSAIGTFVLIGGIITNLPFRFLQKIIAPNLETFQSFIYSDSPFFYPSWQLKHNICPVCNKCIKACPMKALSPRGFKMYRCIGYWTAEHKGKIPDHIQIHMKNILFGCDICQDVCSFNKLKNFILGKHQLEQRFGKVIPRVWHTSQLIHFSAHGFYKAFAGTPVIRMRYYKFRDRVRWYWKVRSKKR